MKCQPGFLVLAIVASLALSGCGANPTGSPPNRPPSTRAVASTPSVSQAPGPSSGLQVVTLPLAYRFHSMTSDGPLAVLDEVASADDGLQSDIVLVDLAHGTWEVLATASTGYHPWNPVISGDNVAWEEWRFSGGSIVGNCDWRIVVMSLSTNGSRVIASGVDTRQYTSNANCPSFDLDGSQLAYTVEDSTASRPWGWQIKVVDLATGQVQRSILTAEEVNGFGLSNGSVAYSEGVVDKAGGFVYDSRLMVSTPDRPTPVQIAADSYEVSFRGGRLAWMGDPGASQSHNALVLAQRIWTAEGPSWAPVPVTPDAPPSGVNQVWPAASSDAVCYARMVYTGPGSLELWRWDQKSGTSSLVPGSDGALVSGQSDGWITWAGGIPGQSVTVSGITVP